MRNSDAPADTTFILERARRASVSMTLARPTAWSAVSFTLSGGLLREDREALDTELRTADLSRFDSPSRHPGGSLGWVLRPLRPGPTRFRWAGPRARRSPPGPRRANRPGRGVFRRPVRRRRRPATSGPTRNCRAAHSPRPSWRFRASAGVARGPDSGRGYFKVGGSARRTFPVRGYENTPRSGRRAWSASLEFRVPAVLVNRALRTPLLHFDRLFLTLFADAGNAWGRDNLSHASTPPALLSAGAEFVYAFGILYLPVRFRIGAGYGFTDPKGAVPYLHLGTSF